MNNFDELQAVPIEPHENTAVAKFSMSGLSDDCGGAGRCAEVGTCPVEQLMPITSSKGGTYLVKLNLACASAEAGVPISVLCASVSNFLNPAFLLSIH